MTPRNYEELQSLFQQYQHRKFTVLAFPSNQFHQERNSESEIKKFATSKYNAQFPLFAKVNVNGKNEHPIFTFLKHKTPTQGFFGTSIKWNFTKFLVDRKGQPRYRYSPRVAPSELRQDIEKLLDESE